MDEIDGRKRLLERRAIAEGAKPQLVTHNIYTKLPDVLLHGLQLTDGGQLWFIKGESGRYECRLEKDLTELFGGNDPGFFGRELSSSEDTGGSSEH